MLLSLDGELDGKQMLALQPTHFVVWTGAMGGLRIRADGIAPMTGLRWDEPDFAFLGQFAGRSDA
jgi:hypothetical protein